MKKSNSIQSCVKKYGVYLFTVDLNNNGLSLMVFDFTEKEVQGVKTSINKIERFIMQRSQFEALIQNKTIEFTEIAPKFVREELGTIYNS